MESETLGLGPDFGTDLFDLAWIRQLPDRLLRDPRQWPRLLGSRCHASAELHSVVWYAALAAESMRRLTARAAFPAFESNLARCGTLATPPVLSRLGTV